MGEIKPCVTALDAGATTADTLGAITGRVRRSTAENHTTLGHCMLDSPATGPLVGEPAGTAEGGTPSAETRVGTIVGGLRR